MTMIENKYRYSLEAAIFTLIAQEYYKTESSRKQIMTIASKLAYTPLLTRATFPTVPTVAKPDIKIAAAMKLEKIPSYQAPEETITSVQPANNVVSTSSILRKANISFKSNDEDKLIKEALKVYFTGASHHSAQNLQPALHRSLFESLWAENALYQTLSPADQLTLLEMSMNRPLMNQLHQALYTPPTQNFSGFPYFFAQQPAHMMTPHIMQPTPAVGVAY